MKDNEISIGEYVRITFPNRPTIMGRVERIPQQTGDCWIIRNGILKKDLVYVQNFNTLERIDKRSSDIYNGILWRF